MTREQDRKKMFGAIMSVLVIVLLFVPAYTTYYIDQRYKTRILEVEGLYENGTIIHAYEPLNTAHVLNLWADDQVDVNQANNDSYYIKKHTSGIKQNRLAWTNFVSYIGNGNYTVTPNYTLMTSPPTYDWRGIGVPMNITLGNLSQFDFLRLTCNDEHFARYLQFRTFPNANQRTSFQEVRPDVFNYFMTLQAKQWFATYPDEKVYLFWDGMTPTALNSSDVTWTFKLEGFVLDPEHQFAWDNEQLYVLTLVPVGVIWTIGLFFSTQVLDVKWDTKPKREYKRGGRR